jgi:hypothetical protein
MNSTSPDNTGRETRLNEAIAAYLEAVESGRAPDREAWLAQHPDLADDLRRFFANHDQMAQLGVPLRAAAPVASPTSAAATPAPSESSADPALGPVRYFGDYELLEEIGRGAMGVVYKARQISLDRLVALKMILAGQLASEDDIRRFHQEAQTAARLQHPNIVAIHEVGQQQGQQYFSMDFVEGHSLAELIGDAPLPPDRANRYLRGIAEAIHYAHQRGTLHRDLKPSNVLIDRFDQPRVTDFGLAKRIDTDAGLTATGAVVGTPSYMPPEQASGERDRVGPASDVYALGAVLYELITGRPPFRAATVLETLLQVRVAEPAPPRSLNPAVGRDLETIVLKCLAKDPVRRYASAREMADDLHALQEGRPIKARRPGVVERAGRWLRQQRLTRASLFLLLWALTLLLALGVLGAWNWSADSRLGWIVLTTDGPALTAQVLDEHDEPILPPFTVPSQQPVPLPAGWCRVMISGPGRLSETYQLLVEQGVEHFLAVGAADRQLWEPLELRRLQEGVEVIDLGGQGGRAHADLIVVRADKSIEGDGIAVAQRWKTEIRVRRVDGGTGKVLWQRSLDKKDQPALQAIQREDWEGVLERLAGVYANGLVGHAPDQDFFVVRPAPDLDGDGTGDLIWVGRSSSPASRPFILAVSGKDGTILWCFQPQVDESRKDDWFVCPPLAVQTDKAGRTTLVTVFAPKPADPWRDPKCVCVRPWVEAIDGRTGKWLWRFEFAAQTNYRRESSEEVAALGVAISVGGPLQALPFVPLISPAPSAPGNRVTDAPPGRYAAAVARAGERLVVAVATYKATVGLDLVTGRPVWPARELPMPLLGLSPNGRFAVMGAFRKHSDLRDWGNYVASLSLASGETAWMKKGGATWGGVLDPPGVARGPLPEVADLDDDGKPETIFAMEVLDGATGEHRWSVVSKGLFSERNSCRIHRDLYPHFTGYDLIYGQHVSAAHIGPDIDGDGQRDLFYAFFQTGEPFGFPADSHLIRFEVRSGADGRLLCQGLHPLGGIHPAVHSPSSLRWLAAGPQGPPRFVMSSAAKSQRTQDGDQYPYLVSQTAIFTPDGKLKHLWPGVQAVNAADLDGDGLPDLYGLQESRSGIRLHAIRGSPPEVWRRPGIWKPAIGPFLVPDRLGGRVPYVTPPLPHGDLDGDGVPDVLVFRPQEAGGRTEAPLKAYSGKDGRRLWQVKPGALLPSEADSIEQCCLLRCRDIDGDGLPEILFAYLVSQSSPRFHATLYLAVISGRTGKVRWKKKAPAGVLYGLADVNGDGVLDLVLYSTKELWAVDGRDGELLRHESGPTVEEPLKDLPFVDLVDSQLRNRFGAYEFRGNGPHELISVSLQDGAVRASDAHTRQLKWERRLPGQHSEILEILPAGPKQVAGVVVKSDEQTLYGLDGLTGKPRWRCGGPGRPVAVLPGADTEELPTVLFQMSGPDVTICLQTLPTDENGSYRRLPEKSEGCNPPGEGRRWVVPLPWEHAARPGLSQVLWPSLACFWILLGFMLARRWGMVVGLLACLILVPCAVGFHEIHASASQCYEDVSFAQAGWFRLWPYTLTAWAGWVMLGNPLVWMSTCLAVWLVAVAVRPPPRPAAGTPAVGPPAQS